MKTAKPSTIDEYIAGFPEETQNLLQQVRTIVKKAAPRATETISYGIPTFNLNDTYLVYFAAWKNHLSVYPAPVAHDDFRKELSNYKTAKGTVQFPYDKPLPLDLITRIVKFRVRDNTEKARMQSHQKK